MEPENRLDGREENQNTVFVDTSLDTHLATIVSDSDTVYDLKKKIMLEHRQCFPATGDIEIHCLKVKRRGNYYHLSDSMLVKSAFGSSRKIWFLSVDASRLEQCDGIQHFDRKKADDQLALPWVTGSCSIDRHDSHADRPLKLSLVHGSLLMHPKIVPFVNQKVPSVDQFTSGDSCHDVSKNVEEDRSSNDDHCKNLEPGSEQLDYKVEEKLHTVNKVIKSKKRIRDVHNEGSQEDPLGSGPSVKKKHKTQRKVGNVKDSEEHRVLTCDTDKVQCKGTSINDENSIEHKSTSKDATLDVVVTRAMNDDHISTISVSQKNINRINKGENYSANDQIATVVPSSGEDVGEETRPQKNTEVSEVIPDVAMVVEKDVLLERPFQISQKEKGIELVQEAVIGNEIHSSPMRISDCERDTPGASAVGHRKGVKRSTKHKAAEKEVSSTPLIKKPHNTTKDATDSSQLDLGSGSQEFAGDQNQIGKHKEDAEVLLNQTPEVKLPESNKHTGASKKRKSKKSTVKNKDVSDISSIVPTPAFDEKIADEGKNDEIILSSVERNEVVEKTLIDDSLVYASKTGDDLVMKDVDISEPTESSRSQVRVEDVEEKTRKELKDTVESKRKKKDVGKSAVNHNYEENLLPYSEKKESLEITSIDAPDVDHGRNDDNVMDNDVEISRTEKIKSQVDAEGINHNSEKQNDKTDGIKESKKKKKTKKSAARNEEEAILKHATVSVPASDGHLHENVKEDRKDVPKERLNDASEVGVGTDIDKRKGKDAQSFDEGLVRKAKKNHKSSVLGRSDPPTKHQSPELELEREKSKSIKHHALSDKTLMNVTESDVSKEKMEGRDDVNNEVDNQKEGSHEIDFMDYFIPNKIASGKAKDATLSGREKKPKKKTKLVEITPDPGKNKEQDDSRDDRAIQSQKSRPKIENKTVLSKKTSTDVVKDSNSKWARKIDGPGMSKPACVIKGQSGPSSESSSSSETVGKSSHYQKSNKQQSIQGQTRVKTMKKSAPVVNSSQNVKSLLNTPGTIFGGDSDKSSADDNATANSDSSTRTPSAKSPSSSGDSPSIDSRRKGSRVVKRKEGDGKNNINSQSRLKNISMADLLRSSSRFKKAKLTASKQVEDTESEPVDFVPDSQPMAK